MSQIVPTPLQNRIINAQASQKLLAQAGPGTGKTEVVARRLVHLIGQEKLRPNQILVLSYSRSAVKALIQRIRSLSDDSSSLEIEELRFLSVRTFDSWCFRMLRFLGYEPSDLLGNDFNFNIELLIKEFEKLQPAEIISKPNLNLGNIRHFIVDEYQDLSGVRAVLVKRLLQILVPDDKSLCGFTILGDPDQAIYDWAMDGLCNKYNFTSRQLIDWIRSVYSSSLVTPTLSDNHRSDKKIKKLVKTASEILKQCEEDNEDPAPVLRELIEEISELSTVKTVFNDLSGNNKLDSLAILCRGNGQIFQLAADIQYQAFKQKKNYTPLRLISGTPPKTLPAWIAILFYQYKGEQISKDHFVKVFKTIFPGKGEAVPCGGNVDAVWKLLLGYANLGEEQTSLNISHLRERILWLDSLPDDEGESDKLFVLTTIHQSKGLEYNEVKIVHDGTSFENNDTDEEGRVLFVGMSRARSNLNLLELQDDKKFWKKETDDGKERWHRWLPYGIYQVELGCEDDFDKESIIRSDLMGSESAVKEVQQLLINKQDELIGKDVILKKTAEPGRANRFHYKIILKDTEQCLGFLKGSVSLELWDMRGGNKTLPANFYNLRIGYITTCTTTRVLDNTVPLPWRESRFWLAPCIHGVGQSKG